MEMEIEIEIDIDMNIYIRVYYISIYVISADMHICAYTYAAQRLWSVIHSCSSRAASAADLWNPSSLFWDAAIIFYCTILFINYFGVCFTRLVLYHIGIYYSRLDHIIVDYHSRLD